jgi:acyl dehydratase
MFENGGYSVLPASDASSSTIFSPVSNKPYAAASGDTNPIHVNPYFSDFVDLPGTITHGMWTSASTRRLVEIFAADNKPSRITVCWGGGFDALQLQLSLSTIDYCAPLGQVCG